MNWNELIRICLGIVTYPRRTLAYIIGGNFLYLGIVVWLTFCVTDSVAAIIHTVAMETKHQSVGSTTFQIITHPATIIRIFSVFIDVYLMNAIATKLYGFGSKYMQLVSCMFFILVLPTVFQPILLVVYQIGGAAITAAYVFLSLILFFWMASLEVRAVMMVYNISLSTAITIWFVPVIFSGAMLLMVQSR